jgi:glycolate oxidase iron-sulfur subunit
VKLSVHEDDLAQCVACGLCLAHCPTFRVTGEEALSPRGRIAAMRAVHEGRVEADRSFIRIVDTCVQCRGCETACPSDVPFGRLMEATRESLADEPGLSYQPWWRRLGYRALGHHRLVLAGSTLLAVAQRTRLVPSARWGLPHRLSLRRVRLHSSGTDAWLFTGCVMDAWQRPVHAAAQALIEATGAGVTVTGSARGSACCGALHEHAGLGHQSRRLAERVMASMPGEAPIVIDAAGCGAMLKSYGALLGTPRAEAFSRRALDVHEYLAGRLDRLPRPDRPLALRVAVQDPCHLRHVQRAHAAVRTVLGPFVDELVELDDEGLCCGAGGAYSYFEPELATAIRARKAESIRRTGTSIVASANPGCAIHVANAGFDVRHPVELMAEALGLTAGDPRSFPLFRRQDHDR